MYCAYVRSISMYVLCTPSKRSLTMKTGKMVGNVDLWQAIQEALKDKTAETNWVKVPSHVDIEGNEKADEFAKEWKNMESSLWWWLCPKISHIGYQAEATCSGIFRNKVLNIPESMGKIWNEPFRNMRVVLFEPFFIHAHVLHEQVHPTTLSLIWVYIIMTWMGMRKVHVQDHEVLLCAQSGRPICNFLSQMKFQTITQMPLLA
mmetsp:Transcript_94327/g.163058  ORF Transcript_94327/g.163058 Transcript_94327/m.163058 type:complete len:204 (-) Transcript_94327:177-788(-)